MSDRHHMRRLADRSREVRGARKRFKDNVHADYTWQTLIVALERGNVPHYDWHVIGQDLAVDVIVSLPAAGMMKARQALEPAVGARWSTVRLHELEAHERAVVAAWLRAARRRISSVYVHRCSLRPRQRWRS